ncbi:uncharacterized protein LOC144542897 [Centroberyx gerrardi]
MHPEWQYPEHLQVKEEQKEACKGQVGEQLQGLEEDHAENSIFTIACVESLIQDSILQRHLSHMNSVESSERLPLPTSSTEPMEAQPRVWEPAAESWHPTEDCAAAENGNSSRNEDWKMSGGPGSSLKILKSKKAKPVKRPRSHISVKRKKSARLSSSRRPTGPHCCKACGKAFHYMYTLRTHAQTHTVDKSCICGVCGKHLESTESLVQHLQTHIERNKCHICGKCFSSNSFLKLHRRFHSPKSLGVMSSGHKKRF